MLYEIAHGTAVSSRLYETGSHAPGMPWDFAIINVYPVQSPAHPISRPELPMSHSPSTRPWMGSARPGRRTERTETQADKLRSYR